jgi:hypothetical protein
MGKDAKVLRDIRFYSSSLAEFRPGSVNSGPAEDLGVPIAAHSVASRIACMLQSEGFSIGTRDHLFIVFTPALPPGTIGSPVPGFYVWHLDVPYGAPASIESMTEARWLRFVQDATIQMVLHLRPDARELIQAVQTRLLSEGPRARILRLAAEKARHRIEVSFDVPNRGDTSYLYVAMVEKTSGRRSEAPPLPLRDFNDAFALVDSIDLTKDDVRLKPRKSLRASLSAQRYSTPILVPLSSFRAERSNPSERERED